MLLTIVQLTKVLRDEQHYDAGYFFRPWQPDECAV